MQPVARHRRRGFTLIELMIVIMIIGLLAAITLSALANASETARAQRTRAIINKLDQLIMERWESYRTRAVPVKPTTGSTPVQAAQLRLSAIRELQRMEMPERVADVWTDNNVLPALPALTRHYRRKALPSATWNLTGNSSAECLYLIVSSMRDGDKSAIEYFSPSEIGDTDGDGMLEILDGWGTPILFLRWAPAYTVQPGPDGQWGRAGVDDDGDGIVDNAGEALFTQTPPSDDVPILTTQHPDGLAHPDPFDPLRIDVRNTTQPNLKFRTFALKPLIASAGPDKEYDISIGTFTDMSLVNDPYRFTSGTAYTPATAPEAGRPSDTNSDGDLQYADNITNHFRGEQ